MITGIGIDLCEFARIDQAFARFGARFSRRILTSSELEQFANSARQVRFLAMRFAVKEAASKALGTGFRQGVAPRQIGVVQDAAGKPSLVLDGGALAVATRLGVVASHVSMTDEGEYAAAVVVMESRSGEAS
ncbi:MAG: holo-ACP synthase [Gammaproteobacteria bacterium]|nr:holo-ACP synthase [Gammaproteobacteria bacterium]NNL99738.1 holo-ACP synthase [Gammaproteobacteria bacterium]